MALTSLFIALIADYMCVLPKYNSIKIVKAAVLSFQFKCGIHRACNQLGTPGEGANIFLRGPKVCIDSMYEKNGYAYNVFPKRAKLFSEVRSLLPRYLHGPGINDHDRPVTWVQFFSRSSAGFI